MVAVGLEKKYLTKNMKKRLIVIVPLLIALNFTQLDVFAYSEREEYDKKTESYTQAQRIAEAYGIEILDVETALGDLEEDSVVNENGNICDIPQPLIGETIIDVNFTDNNHTVAGGGLFDFNGYQGARLLYRARARRGAYDISIVQEKHDNLLTALQVDGDIYNPGGEALVIDGDEQGDIYYDQKCEANGVYTAFIFREFVDTDTRCIFNIKPHIDILENTNSGSWIPRGDSGAEQSPYYYVNKYAYMDPEEAFAFYETVSNSALLDARDYIINLASNAAIAYISSEFGTTAKIAGKILVLLKNFPGLVKPLKETELEEISKAGGGIDYIHKTMKNGILAKSVTVWRATSTVIQPVFLNVYEAHKQNRIAGIVLFYGDFDTEDCTPLWLGAM